MEPLSLSGGMQVDIDYGLLKVKRVIFHEVPRRSTKDNALKPALSEIESPTTSDVRNMLRARLIDSAGNQKRGMAIEFDPEADSPVPLLVMQYTEKPSSDALVQMSQAIAVHLYESQGPISPPGLVAVIEFSVDDLPGVAILKIEQEEGARLLRQELEAGKKTFDIQHFKDLILTGRTKVFKVALFIRNDDTFISRACDFQRGYSSFKELADFFLGKFLGCRMAESPEVTTKTFYEASSEFFNQRFGSDPEAHARVYTHLQSALTSESQILSPKKFAEKYIPTKFRKDYLQHLQERGLELASFDVATALIQHKLNATIYNFEDGIVLRVPLEIEEDTVNISNEKDGSATVTFRRRLKKVKGK